MRQRTAVLTLILISVVVGVGNILVNRASAQQPTTPARIERDFQEAYKLAKNYYAGEVDTTRLTESAIQGMLLALDPHSSYLDAKEFAEMRREQESRFYGIGVNINRRNGRVHILSVLPNTPAEEAGLRYGDAILAVDDIPVVDWGTSQVARKVRGERHTMVKLTIERVGEPAPLTFHIRRQPVPLPSVQNAFMIRPGVGYIGLTRGFQATTIDELNEAISKLKADGMESLILDLRGNPGGLLNQAVQVASRFLEPGEVIVEVKGRRSSRPPYRALSSNPDDFPLVVLINQASASASEIVAGALQDHDRALIVGEPSFGKGLVQTVYPIMRGEGGAVTLSTARYYTPAGRLIQRDYSKLSVYDYYVSRSPNQTQKKTGPASTTDGGRPVYSGGGIDPDVLVPTPNDPVRAKVFAATFEFVRHLVAGQIQGYASWRVTRAQTPRPDTIPEVEINDGVWHAFRQFVDKRREFQLSAAELETHKQYALQRIREEVVTARFGAEAGNRVALTHDEQLEHAVRSVPQAKELVKNLRQAKSKS